MVCKLSAGVLAVQGWRVGGVAALLPRPRFPAHQCQTPRVYPKWMIPFFLQLLPQFRSAIFYVSQSPPSLPLALPQTSSGALPGPDSVRLQEVRRSVERAKTEGFDVPVEVALADGRRVSGRTVAADSCQNHFPAAKQRKSPKEHKKRCSKKIGEKC